MGRALSNRNVIQARFELADFDGDFLASFGRPELRGAWLIYGGSGCGKTTFVMQVCKYLTQFGRVAYDSTEQGLSASLQTAWKRVGMEEAGSRIILLEKESLKELTVRLKKKQSPDIIVIDSLHYWIGFKMADYMKLRDMFPDKLFIFIAHERKGQPKGTLAQSIRYDADIKVRVEGYKAFFTTRYETDNSKTGVHEGGADFIIWEQGAKEYWAGV